MRGYNQYRLEMGQTALRRPQHADYGSVLPEDMPQKPLITPDISITPNGIVGNTERGKSIVGEIRTTSSTGGMKGVKPERHSLIPPEALDSIARLYAFGAKKYADHNWRKGYEWTKSYDSLFRHASASLRGEDYDEETGEPHLAGVVFHAFTLMCFLFDYEQYGHFDDRYKPTTKWNRDAIEETTSPEEVKVIKQELEAIVQTPIEDVIEYLAGMYDNWSSNTAKELRRVVKDLRTDKNRNVKSFTEFRENFPVHNISGIEHLQYVGTRETEIEPIAPDFRVSNYMVTIPTVVGAVYYHNNKHVIGSFQVHKTAEITAVALPGYRFAENTDSSWVYFK